MVLYLYPVAHIHCYGLLRFNEPVVSIVYQLRTKQIALEVREDTIVLWMLTNFEHFFVVDIVILLLLDSSIFEDESESRIGNNIESRLKVRLDVDVIVCRIDWVVKDRDDG